jgi:sugar/nucleoside kinase (ribokinase family)
MKSETVDLVGVGLNATDTLISVSSFPGPGSKAEVHSLQVMPGGQVATAVIACARWGLGTRYVGNLGDDAAAAIHREAFRIAGVEAHITTVPNCHSAQSHIIVDAQGERSVLWHRDPRLGIAPEELKREWITNARALLVDGCDTAAATQAARWAREAGIAVIADLDEVYPNVDPLLENIDYLIASRDFPPRISGKAELREALQWLQQRFGSRLAAATLGTAGVLAWDGQQFYEAAAYRVAAVDTTGAGDIFHAGFIFGLLQKWAMQKILDFACAAAALNCTAAGARGNIAAVDEIEELVTKGRRYSSG